MKLPFLMTDEGSIEISLRALVKIIDEFESLGLKEQALADADAKGIQVLIPKDTVNFVKTALFQAGAHRTSEDAEGIVKSATCVNTGDGDIIYKPQNEK